MAAIALNQALRRVFRSYDQSFNADMLEALFYIRDFPGTTVSNLAHFLGYEHLSRATNLVDAMSNRGRLGNRAGGKPGKRQGGWGVIERRRKPEDRKFEQLFITPKGEEAAAGLAYAARRTWKRIEHLLERD